MRTITLLLISLATLLSASESNPRIQRSLQAFDESVASAQEQRDAAIRAAEEAYAESVARAQQRALRDIKRLVTSRTDAATTAAVYREVLTLDPSDEDAVGFFTSIGTLEQVLESIQPRIETDLLGNVTSAGQPRLNVGQVQVLSAGFDDGNEVKIVIGNETVVHSDQVSTRTGLNVVAYNANSIVWSRHYDTFNNSQNGDRFASDIDSLPNGTFVIVASKDAFHRRGNFSESAQEALFSLGGKININGTTGFRDSYILIGRKGLERGNAIELRNPQYSGPVRYPPEN